MQPLRERVDMALERIDLHALLLDDTRIVAIAGGTFPAAGTLGDGIKDCAPRVDEGVRCGFADSGEGSLVVTGGLLAFGAGHHFGIGDGSAGGWDDVEGFGGVVVRGAVAEGVECGAGDELGVVNGCVGGDWRCLGSPRFRRVGD